MRLWMSRFEEGEYRHSYIDLPDNHGWRASPGNVVFVANRGEAMFEIPRKMLQTNLPNQVIRFSDKRPPNENYRLDLVVIRFAPHMKTDAALADMLEDLAAECHGGGLYDMSRIRDAQRPDYELAWMEASFHDDEEDRTINCRLCLARKGNLYVHFISDYYPEFSRPATRLWKGLLATLQVGEHITDPTLRSKMN